MAKTKRKKFKFDLKDPKTKFALAAIAIIAVVVYGWYEQVYTPLHESVTALTERKTQLEAELMRINALKPQLDRLRQESIALEARLDSLKNIFPDRNEVPRLIRDLTAMNRKSNISTTRFTPKPDVVRDYYVENKYDVSITGNYHNIGELFSHLANFQLIVNLSNVTITANPGFTPGGNVRTTEGGAQAVERQPSVLATFELTTFSSRR
ncbi:MAG: type 4a pilus biogenesis protein PilO [Chitinispirillales bacterium]|jgi:Tfp pilus assembly protein PilO|nr:type 4a pilus biogenesis protein PilO [Chitinispirillales bacterium]